MLLLDNIDTQWSHCVGLTYQLSLILSLQNFYSKKTKRVVKTENSNIGCIHSELVAPVHYLPLSKDQLIFISLPAPAAYHNTYCQMLNEMLSMYVVDI